MSIMENFTNNEKLYFLYLRDYFKKDKFFNDVYRKGKFETHKDVLYCILANEYGVKYKQTRMIDEYEFYENFYTKCLTSGIIDTKGKTVINYLVNKIVKADKSNSYIRIELILSKEIQEIAITNELDEQLRDVDVSIFNFIN